MSQSPFIACYCSEEVLHRPIIHSIPPQWEDKGILSAALRFTMGVRCHKPPHLHTSQSLTLWRVWEMSLVEVWYTVTWPKQASHDTPICVLSPSRSWWLSSKVEGKMTNRPRLILTAAVSGKRTIDTAYQIPKIGRSVHTHWASMISILMQNVYTKTCTIYQIIPCILEMVCLFKPLNIYLYLSS